MARGQAAEVYGQKGPASGEDGSLMEEDESYGKAYEEPEEG